MKREANPPSHPQSTKRPRKDVVKTCYFWSQRRLRLVSNGSCDDFFLRRREDVFQETSSSPLPGDVLKRLRLHQDFSGKSKGPSRDNLWTFYLHTF